MAYIGSVSCKKCGIQYIDNRELVTVWHTADTKFEICEIECPECHRIITESIDPPTAYIFKLQGCNFKDLNDKYEPLTEELINNWNIGEDLEKILI